MRRVQPYERPRGWHTVGRQRTVPPWRDRPSGQDALICARRCEPSRPSTIARSDAEPTPASCSRRTEAIAIVDVQRDGDASALPRVLPNRPVARACVWSEALGAGAGGSVGVHPPLCAKPFRWGADAVDVGLEVVTVHLVVGGNWRRHVMTHTRRRATAPLPTPPPSTACRDE
jgi:hypothetical protein